MKRNLLKIGTIFLLFICPSSHLWSQTGSENDKATLFAAAGYTFPYELQKPDLKLTLPNDLIEISGLCWMSPGKLACVQDEDGIIFIYDLNQQAIIREIEFEDDGDYEGIELIGEDAWVLKSNGNLYEVSDWLDDEKRSTQKYKTDLSKKNDCEGLGFDPSDNGLLIACKGHPRLDDEDGKSKKAIYRFDLKEKDLDKKPIYTIDLDQVKNYKKYNTMTTWGVEILSMLDESKGDVSFQPSGIAIHPMTGNIYVTGAVGDMIIVLHPTGEILAMIALDTAKFRQPEGICFDPQGNLYISNEGKDSRANLMKFNYNK
ncbi:MAG: hypothetical protein KQI35_12890 [Bacteroidetes bacterium]|nr:hypothetical protein [Bacteroidota bacterium]